MVSITLEQDRHSPGLEAGGVCSCCTAESAEQEFIRAFTSQLGTHFLGKISWQKPFLPLERLENKSSVQCLASVLFSPPPCPVFQTLFGSSVWQAALWMICQIWMWITVTDSFCAAQMTFLNLLIRDRGSACYFTHSLELSSWFSVRKIKPHIKPPNLKANENLHFFVPQFPPSRKEEL